MERCHHHGRGALTTLIPKNFEGWRGKNLRINTSDLPHEHSCQNSNERLGQTTLQKPRATISFRRLAGGFPARQIHTATDFTLY